MKKIYILAMLVLTGMTAMAQTSVWNGGKTVWTQGTGTESDPYLIESADNLAFLAYMVNKGYDTQDLHFLLTTDIDLNGSENLQWIPIGLGDRYYNEDGCNVGIGSNIRPSFHGHFNGGDHTISNIYIDNSEQFFGSNVGLFGTAEGYSQEQEVYPAVIENIFLTNGYIKGYCCGGIVGNGGRNGTTQISRCWNGATIEAFEDTGSICGGIVGWGAYQINNCYNKGELKGSYAGGIIGYGTAANIEECFNEGNVSGIYAGGIYGYSMRAIVNIHNCYNTGNIDASGEAPSNAIAGPAAGGIAGFIYGTSSITNCYNVGEVSSTKDAGCILAFGSLTTLENNYYVSTCSAEGEGTPLSEDYMRSQEFVDVLNGRDPVWGMDENNINNGFPILVENNLVVSELSKPGFKVYPNPSQGHLTVEGNGLLTVFNILGQKVLSGNIDGITSIELPKGMYFMTLGNSTQKVIVE